MARTYSVKEAAAALGVSRQTLENWINPASKYYIMTAVRIAGHNRIEAAELRRVKKLMENLHNDGPEGPEGE